MMHNPSLITIEGMDFAGKTTAALYLKKRFEAMRVPVMLLREPGGTDIGEKIREILKDPKNTDISVDTELLLFYSSRMQLIKEEIMPALERGYIVILDRFIDSSMAYQGYGFDMKEKVHALQKAFIRPFLEIDHTLYLEVNEETIRYRRKKRAEETGESLDRIESRDDAFFHRVRQGFEYCRAYNQNRFRTIDASLNAEEVQKQLDDFIKTYYQSLFSRYSYY